MTKKENIKSEEHKTRSLTAMLNDAGNMATMLEELKDDAEKYFALGVLSALKAKSEARKEAS